MSLILDALRKSEAERRRGQSPDLFSASGIAAPASRPGLRWWPVAVFAVLMLASGWVIWDGRTQRALDEVAEAGVAGDAARAGGAGETEPGEGTGGDETRGAAGADAAGGERIDGAMSPPLASDLPTRMGPAPDASAPSASAPTASSAPAAAAPALGPPVATALTPAPRDAAALTPAAGPRPIAPAFPPAPALPAPAAEPPAEEALPTLAVLDSITRGTLPPLKLSMHVWGQEPGKRFAIVDGQRVSEGSLLGNGVVEQIRRDGVVINVNGQRLLLPKP